MTKATKRGRFGKVTQQRVVAPYRVWHLGTYEWRSSQIINRDEEMQPTQCRIAVSTKGVIGPIDEAAWDTKFGEVSDSAWFKYREYLESLASRHGVDLSEYYRPRDTVM